MKKIFLSIALLMICGSLSLVFAKPAKRIVFKKGATKAYVSGWLSSVKDKSVFVLRVRKGQNIEVRPDGGTIAISTTVITPGGEDVGDRDMQGNSGTENTVAGDYKIIVYPSQKDDKRRGSFKIEVTVK